MKNGKGRYLYSNGEVYEGNWKNELKDGECIFISLKGERSKEIWNEGKRIVRKN